MLLGAAIFPGTSKYGGGPENMAIDAARRRWRRCSGGGRQLASAFLQAAKLCRTCGIATTSVAAEELSYLC